MKMMKRLFVGLALGSLVLAGLPAADTPDTQADAAARCLGQSGKLRTGSGSQKESPSCPR